MSESKLTDALARNLPPPAAGLRVEWDGEIKGLGLRVTKAGARSWILNYRSGGVQRQLTIGSFPDWPAKAARDEAKALKRRIDQGEDPMAERHAERRATTMAELADHYRKVHLPKKRPTSQAGDELTLRLYVLPRLGKKKIAAISHADIADLHRDISKKTPPTANRTVALLSKMLNLALKQGWVTSNPCKGVEKNAENRRERYLTPVEVRRLISALDGHAETVSAAAIKFLLLTGARRSEVLGAMWPEFDLEAGTWVKPSAHTKQKRTHRIPLSNAALQVLRDRKAAQEAETADAKRRGIIRPPSTAVFPGANGKPLTEVKKSWAALCRKADLGEYVPKRDAARKPVHDQDGKPVMVFVPNVRLHDLRHTHASLLASNGLSLPIIGQLLGHTQPATTHRYAHLLDDPLRAAAEIVGTIVTDAGGTTAKVEHLPARHK